jgi:hypothetical protein
MQWRVSERFCEVGRLGMVKRSPRSPSKVWFCLGPWCPGRRVCDYVAKFGIGPGLWRVSYPGTRDSRLDWSDRIEY